MMMTTMVIMFLDATMTIEMMVAMVLMITCDVDDIAGGGNGDGGNTNHNDNDDDNNNNGNNSNE